MSTQGATIASDLTEAEREVPSSDRRGVYIRTLAVWDQRERGQAGRRAICTAQASHSLRVWYHSWGAMPPLIERGMRRPIVLLKTIKQRGK